MGSLLHNFEMAHFVNFLFGMDLTDQILPQTTQFVQHISRDAMAVFSRVMADFIRQAF